MVLSRPDIIARIKKDAAKPLYYRSLSFSPELSLDPLDCPIDQCSIDLRLGFRFTIFKKKDYAVFRTKMTKEMFEEADLWDEKEYQEQDIVTLKRGGFVLAQTREKVHLPHDLMGLVEGRSSWARLGIGVHVTAPKIDPGYNKRITLELTNHSEVDYQLEAGVDRACQLILLKISTPLKEKEIYGKAEDIFAHSDKPIPTKKKPKLAED
jgi:deoxycytidine triphosphate deaminase